VAAAGNTTNSRAHAQRAQVQWQSVIEVLSRTFTGKPSYRITRA
jgi:hypothetical protein